VKKLFSFFLIWSIYFLLTSCQNDISKQSGICLSFDDKNLEQWIEILPILDKYDAKVTFFLTGVGKLSEQEKIWLKQIQEAGHEIGAHGEIHVSANTYIKEHGFRKYWEDEIQSNLDALESLNIYPQVFAYPYGEKNRLIDLMLWFQFKGTRNVVGIGDISKAQEKAVVSSNNRFYYSSISIDQGELESLDLLVPLFEKAKIERKVLFLHAHDIGDKEGYFVSKQRLEEVLRMAIGEGFRFISFRGL